MPAKAPRPCKHCKHTTTNTNGYCDSHQDKAVGWNRRKSSWNGKGSTRVWRKKRAAILRRDKYLCVTCNASGIYTPATEVDHIINKARGGDDSESNLQSLCKSCHQIKTSKESRIGGVG